MEKTIKIEQLVDGKLTTWEHKLKLDYTCGSDPCDCYLLPQEREHCSSDCRCYEPSSEDACGCGKTIRIGP